MKFRYFFEEILKKPISENQVNVLANQFSLIMRERLVDSSLIIPETIKYIEELFNLKKEMHIVSGSDNNELIELCSKINVDKYFKTINGSPTPKNELVSRIITRDNLKISITGSCAIGLKHKIKLHYNEINPISSISKPISLCIPEGNPYIFEQSYNNNLSSFSVGQIIALPINSQNGGVILESIAASAAVGSPTGIALVIGLPMLMFFLAVLSCEN